MPDERDDQVQDPEMKPDEPTAAGSNDDDSTSAQTRAGSNLPNAAGHRGDGTHE